MQYLSGLVVGKLDLTMGIVLVVWPCRQNYTVAILKTILAGYLANALLSFVEISRMVI